MRGAEVVLSVVVDRRSLGDFLLIYPLAEDATDQGGPSSVGGGAGARVARDHAEVGPEVFVHTDRHWDEGDATFMGGHDKCR